MDMRMSTDIIVSYDGTPNDDDALALGKMLSRSGGTLALAYVRHAHEFDPEREALAQHDAQRRLQLGADWLGDPEVARHVVVNPSTGEGLARLAEAEGASVVVFGSDYRTPPGRVEPGASAQQLLEGGPVAIAVAPAGLRTNGEPSIKSIALAATEDDTAAKNTAVGLAGNIGAEIVDVDDPGADLIVVGSQSGASEGRIALSGATRGRLNTARSAVLVVPNGKAVLL
jgi:nucleotide-binding universal stress UspA family protein